MTQITKLHLRVEWREAMRCSLVSAPQHMAGPDCRHLIPAASTAAGTAAGRAAAEHTAAGVFLIKTVYGSSPLLIAISAAINATYCSLASRRAGALVKNTRYQQTAGMRR